MQLVPFTASEQQTLLQCEKCKDDARPALENSPQITFDLHGLNTSGVTEIQVEVGPCDDEKICMSCPRHLSTYKNL